LITRSIRTLSNYTTPLPSRQIESSLLGAIFDPYVRFIVWEGIRQWWREDLEHWLACPPEGDPYPHSSIADIPASSPAILDHLKSASSFMMGLLPAGFGTYLSLAYPIPLKETEDFPTGLLQHHPSLLSEEGKNMTFPACPYTWASQIQSINCEVAWPKKYTGNREDPLIELDTEEYIGKLSGDKTIEKLLAMAGLRLAKVVNEALGGPEGTEDLLYLGY
jgi:hypothetical protein